MKKHIIALLFACISVAGFTQNNAPTNASVVIKYYGAHLSNSVPVSKLNSYGFIKDNLFKVLNIDSTISIENTGIDFGKDVVQYLVTGDSSMNFVTAISLSDVKQFLQLVKRNYKSEILTEKKGNYELMTVADDKYLGWNDKEAILIYSQYNKSGNYYYTSPVDTTVVAVDSAAAIDAPYPPVMEENNESITQEEMDNKVIEEEKQEIKKPKTVKGKSKGKSKASSKTKKKPAKKTKPKVEIEEPIEEVQIEEPPMSAESTTDAYAIADSIEQAKKDQWYKDQDAHITGKQKYIADSIMQISFAGNIVSIENDFSYKKVIDPAAHVTVWLNYDNIISQLGSFFGKGLYSRSYYTALGLGNTKLTNGFKTGINLYFDKDKMRIEQKAYSPDGEMANLGKEIYHSKQNKKLAGYINPDHVAYLSASVNTKALADYYYKLIRQYLSSTPYVKEYAEIVDVYMNLMEIVIDEKAISELMPGNMVFVLHDLQSKTVTYKDFIYDDNFKQTEVEKTKQEMSPNFTFVMETKKPAFMEKLAKLPLKYAEKIHVDYKDKGGYYELPFEPGKYPINSLYFMVKDDKVIVTTSKQSIDFTLANGGYTLSADVKKSVLKNNYAFNLNTKRLLQQVSPELSTDQNRKIRKYLEENIGDIKMESRLKDNMIQSTATMNITGQHSNSFEFIFNVIDSINKMMENDKKEKEEKVY